MNKVVAIIVFWCCAVFSFGQTNLVPNGSFDSVFTDCQLIFDNYRLTNIKNWYNPSNSTTDEYYYCFNQFMISNGIPQNVIGNQFPKSDSIFLGVHLANLQSNYREYIATKLIKPLKKGYTYCGEFYASLADSANYAVSLLSMFFSEDSVFENTFQVLNFSPQIQNDSLNMITDKQNWVKVSGSFVAQGGEKYLVIGNFSDSIDVSTHSLKVSNYSSSSGWNKEMAYYYIDNVSVYACDSPAVSINDSSFALVGNVFSPNQDGVNDMWQVNANQVLQLRVQVFNRWGEEVYVFNSSALGGQQDTTLSMTYKPAWDGFTKSGLPVSDGTYFYVISYTLPNGEAKLEKGTLTLIR
jgi:gliding motility-associated-like protein